MKPPQLPTHRAGRFVALAAMALAVATGIQPAVDAIARSSRARVPAQIAQSTAPGFGPATMLTAGGATGVAASINNDANTLIAWDDETGPGHTYVRTAGAKGVLGPVQGIWTGAGYHVVDSLANDGTGAVAWMSGQSLFASVARPNRSFGTAQTLASTVSPVLGAQTIVATPGRAVAIWLVPPSNGVSAIDYAIAGSDGTFGPVQTLSASDIAPPLLATADSAGDVIVAYWAKPASAQTARALPAHAATTTTTRTSTTTTKTSTTKTSTTGTKKPKSKKPSKPKPTGSLAYAVLPATGTQFGASQTIATLTGSAKPSANVSLSSGPGGVVIGYAGSSFQVAMLGASGLTSPPQKAGTVPSSSAVVLAGPAVAFPGQGGAVAAWSESAGGSTGGPYTGSHLVVSQQQTTGGFSSQQLTTPSTLSQSPLAAATRDLAIVVFGQGPENNEMLDYSVRQTGESFSPPRSLTTAPLVPPVIDPPSSSVYVSPLPAALAATGSHALVVWISGEQLFAARLGE